jgi:hypothetical protein
MGRLGTLRSNGRDGTLQLSHEARLAVGMERFNALRKDQAKSPALDAARTRHPEKNHDRSLIARQYAAVVSSGCAAAVKTNARKGRATRLHAQ